MQHSLVASLLNVFMVMFRLHRHTLCDHRVGGLNPSPSCPYVPVWPLARVDKCSHLPFITGITWLSFGKGHDLITQKSAVAGHCNMLSIYRLSRHHPESSVNLTRPHLVFIRQRYGAVHHMV